MRVFIQMHFTDTIIHEDDSKFANLVIEFTKNIFH